MLRLGLCCQLLDSPIKFRTATATALLRLSLAQRREKLAEVCRSNATALRGALEYCAAHAIGAFRVNSQILPVKTHPVVGYSLDELPGGMAIIELFRDCGRFAESAGLRLSFHPDQFVVLSSPQEHVLKNSLAEIEYQAEVAQWVGADVINIHAGGAYGDKPAALDRLRRAVDRLSGRARDRLTLENDDRTYTPADLLPVCQRDSIPLVYDVHHHRCLSDGLSVEKASEEAISTWRREPLFHVSSPREGWTGRCPHYHADFIDPADFPKCWREQTLTIEVEAKAKQLAVAKLRAALRRRRILLWKNNQAASLNCVMRTERPGR
jgi:UV DNA damage endonuclease